MVVGQIPSINPAAVRSPTHVVKRDKTPVLNAADARQPLHGIETKTVVGRISEIWATWGQTRPGGQ